ncbi:hypothetical protein MUK42_19388, partial [Musa troglodytarum]
VTSLYARGEGRAEGGDGRCDDDDYLIVGGSRRARKNTVIALLNLTKSDRDKIVKDVREVDGAKATMRALVGNDNEMSARGKSNTEALFRVLESGRGS